MKRSLFIAGLIGTIGLVGLAPPAPLDARRAETLAVLTVGGGPRPALNQVAIENNVRYVSGLLPKSATTRTLFADGRPESVNVLYTEPKPDASEAETAFKFLFEGGQSGVNRLRASQLRSVDGAARKEDLIGEMERLAGTGAGSILLYFTGHGDKGRNLDNNVFALWEERKGGGPGRVGDDGLTVRDLASQIKKLPADRPVTLVMVQCYSGSFGNILFENGDPDAALVERPICGFFATTRERVAAGCTPEINEAEYHDFTSYFYAALTGKDRVGRAVKASDYDKNGVVGMDEAYLYALVSEPSIDVPICTSDVFLRRFVNVQSDDEIAKMSFAKVRQTATPGQRDALDKLSEAVGATGDDRLVTALADVRARQGSGGGVHHADGGNMASAARKLTAARDRLKGEFAGLADRRNSAAYADARARAVAALAARPDALRDILDARKTVQKRQQAAYEDELRGARWLRLLRLAKTVVLEDRLRRSGDKALVARFDRLKALESRNPLR